MGIKIITKGFFSTIQDLGRIGYREFGVPMSGVMDRRAATIANILVGNNPNEAVIEMLLVGNEIEFITSNTISITGADLNPRINNIPVDMYRSLQVSSGDILSFMGRISGSYCYVSFAGGLNVPIVMESKSTYVKAELGGYNGRKLQDGDVINFCSPKVMPTLFVNKEDLNCEITKLRVVMGTQDDCFTKKGIDTFLSSVYTVTNEFDRMGCRLDGETIQHKKDGNIISDAISFGAIQVPSHGKPIVMLADRQTVGGYTKIATIASVDIPKLVQRVSGNRIIFHSISVEEAQRLYIQEQQEFKNITKQQMEFFIKVNGIEYNITVQEVL